MSLRRCSRSCALVLSLPLAAFAAAAEEAAKPDKSAYTLFHRTPPELMREMSTDRPDKTESAYSVDAGRFQIELDAAGYALDHETDTGSRSDSWGLLNLNFKMGLTQRIDLQTVIPSYLRVTVDDTLGSEVRRSGFGDITSRLKINLWGNDGGKTAMAVMPYLKWPTNQNELANDHVEGGIILPLAVALPAGFGLGCMAQLEVNKLEGGGRHYFVITSITVGHDIVGNLAGYVELFGGFSTGNNSEWVVTSDFGLTYALTDNLQLDAGVNFGLTDIAVDTNAFLGLSVRF